jgi:pimeloyl-ACP methyl ester carboxylesterase
MTTAKDDKLSVRGATIFYRVRGSGPLLLILAGGHADADATDGLCNQLIDRYTVVTYDRRGSSRSTIEPPAENLTLATHSNDAHLLLAGLTNESVFVFWQQYQRADWPGPHRSSSPASPPSRRTRAARVGTAVGQRTGVRHAITRISGGRVSTPRT